MSFPIICSLKAKVPYKPHILNVSKEYKVLVCVNVLETFLYPHAIH